MTIQSPLWLENLDYSATDMRRLITVLLPVAGVVDFADLSVSQHAGGVNRSVDVASGWAVIVGTDVAQQGHYLFRSDAVVNVPLAAAPGSGQSRIDLIVAQIRDQDADGGANNDGVIAAVTGTAASTGSQVAPSAPASSLVLAQVLVGPSVTTIVNGNITDERTYTAPQLTHAAGSATSVVLSGTPVAALTTASLAVGSWLVNVTGFGPVATSDQIDVTVAAGTATASFTGATECTVGTDGSGFLASLQPLAMTFVAVVTVAGTIKINGQSSGVSGTQIDLIGYTALRVA